jgi:hypothetical protein
VGKNFEGGNHGVSFKVLSQHLPGQTETKCEKQPGYLVAGCLRNGCLYRGNSRRFRGLSSVVQ